MTKDKLLKTASFCMDKDYSPELIREIIQTISEVMTDEQWNWFLYDVDGFREHETCRHDSGDRA